MEREKKAERLERLKEKVAADGGKNKRKERQ